MLKREVEQKGGKKMAARENVVLMMLGDGGPADVIAERAPVSLKLSNATKASQQQGVVAAAEMAQHSKEYKATCDEM